MPMAFVLLLLFHMPGRWRLLFDVERGGRTVRLSTDMVLE